MNTNITVYVKVHGCPQCWATKRALKRLDIAYTEVVLTQEMADNFREQGFVAAPIVITPDETWTGFQPDKLEALKND